VKVIYLHGFRSSPDSSKARRMAWEMAKRGLTPAWHCPQLPASPREAVELAMRIAQSGAADGLTLIGSSLGGYYATWLAERLGCRCIVLNPVVNAVRDLASQVGTHKQYYSDAPFVFLPKYVDELAALRAPPLTDVKRYFLLAATGDEVLDWREMQDRYAGCRQHIVQGGDHALSDFEPLLPEILQFALGDNRP
jgi:predicted esterase YcpF (UPF0227 family)